MPIYKLRPEQIEGFANGPEVDMGIQVGLDLGDSPLVVASGRIAIRYDGEFGDQLEIYQEFVGLGRDSFRIDDYGYRLETWVNILPDCPPITPMSVGPARILLPFIHLGPRGPCYLQRGDHLTFTGIFLFTDGAVGRTFITATSNSLRANG
jgi:hypothetical protein